MFRALTRVGLVTAAAVTLLACATTPSLQSTWRHPSVEQLNVEGKRVATLVLSDDEAIRHGAEDALARGISAHGGLAVPAYTLLPKDLVHDKKRARELLEQAEVDGVVAMRAVAWASRSQTMDASEAGLFIRHLAKKVSAELEKQGLLADPARVSAVGF